MRSPESQPASQVNNRIRHLLSGVSEHGDQHLAEVERDLLQMDVLLEEAIRKLGVSFMAIHQAISRQQETLRGMVAESADLAACTSNIEALQSEISRHVGDAVTGLQFQDMTSQLIRRMVAHLSGLRDVLGSLDADGEGLKESADEALLALLSHAGERAGASRAALAESARSPVSQRHMESGEIELF